MSQCYQPAAHFPNKQSDQSCFRLAIHIALLIAPKHHDQLRHDLPGRKAMLMRLLQRMTPCSPALLTVNQPTGPAVVPTKPLGGARRGNGVTVAFWDARQTSDVAFIVFQNYFRP